MNEERNTNEGACRACWQNCGVQADTEMLDIDKMEDTIAPLDEQTTRIRELITRFESCYHEADKEAERIIRAIGDGRWLAASMDKTMRLQLHAPPDFWLQFS